MRVFVDSADQKQIENWLDQGVVDGVTTNPSIMFKDGATDLEECARRLAELLGERTGVDLAFGIARRRGRDHGE